MTPECSATLLRMLQQNSNKKRPFMADFVLSYCVARNGAAAPWRWEVACNGAVVDRGIATTEVKARATAVAAALLYEAPRDGSG